MKKPEDPKPSLSRPPLQVVPLDRLREARGGIVHNTITVRVHVIKP